MKSIKIFLSPNRAKKELQAKNEELASIQAEMADKEALQSTYEKQLENAFEDIKKLKSDLILVQHEKDTLKNELSATQIKLAEMERTRRENDEIMRGLVEMEEKLKSVEQMKRSYETRISALKKRLAEANKMLTVQAKNRSMNYFDVIEMSEEDSKVNTPATSTKTDAHIAKPHTPSLFDLAEEKPSASNWLQPLPDD